MIREKYIGEALDEFAHAKKERGLNETDEAIRKTLAWVLEELGDWYSDPRPSAAP